MGIFCASLLSGALLSIWLGGLGWPFFTFFVLAALALVILTEAQGLFIFVASVPVIFAITLLASAWLIVRGKAPDHAPVSKTQIITAVYPLAQYFPILISVSIAAFLIAFLRVKFLSASSKKTANSQISAERRRDREADRRNRRATSRARKQSEQSQVTVNDLLKKSHGPHGPLEKPRPSSRLQPKARPQPRPQEQDRPRERSGYPDPGAVRIRPEDSTRVVGKTRSGRFQHEVEHGPRRPISPRPDRREAASRQYAQRPRPEQRGPERFEDRFEPRAPRVARREPQRPQRMPRPQPSQRPVHKEGSWESRRPGEPMEHRGRRETFERDRYQAPQRRPREPRRGDGAQRVERPQRPNRGYPGRYEDERFRR